MTDTPSALGGDEVPQRKPYRRPTLIVHGDLRSLTAEKGGDKDDGGGKPATRIIGPKA